MKPYELCIYCDPNGEEEKALKEHEIVDIKKNVCDSHSAELHAEVQLYSQMGMSGELANLSEETRKKMFPMIFPDNKKTD